MATAYASRTEPHHFRFANASKSCRTARNSAYCGGDQDGDGVPDIDDHCVSTDWGDADSSTGCAPDQRNALIASEVYFPLNRSTLTERARFRLQVFASKLRDLDAHHSNIELQLIGHTDTRGHDDQNMALSLDRARNVRLQLQRWLPPSVPIVIAGLGEQHPRTTGGKPTTHAGNRRVEIIARRLRQSGENQ